MPRARNLKPSFFKDEDLVECGPMGMLLFEGLWCLADREGRLEDRPKLIKAEIFPYTSTSVEALLKVLAEKNFIIRYEVENKKYIEVRNFKKHQHPHVKEGPSTIPAPGRHHAGTMQVPEKAVASSGNSGASTSDSLILIPDSLNLVSGAEIDHEAEFLSRWDRWPSKGRTRQPLCQQNWCEIFARCGTHEARALLGAIDDGLELWLNSQQFEKGYVFAFADFLAQRRWQEQPEQVEAQKEETLTMEEQDLHWAEFQRLTKSGVDSGKAHEKATQMILEQRRRAKKAS